MSTITTALLTSNRSIRSGIGNSIDPTGFIVRPYISDIHNGIYNPNFTYTGGQAIVPDENGILRRTPAGYPAVEGGAWSGTNWLPPTAGITRSISTRKGLRTIQTADTFKGMLVEPAMTNKCTCRKSNPTDITGLVKNGDAASVLSVVNDAAALTAAGLSDICTSGMVYKLDNSAGVGTAYVNSLATVGNTNPHSFSGYFRGGTGRLFDTVSGDGIALITASANYVRYKLTLTPGLATRAWAVLADAGAIVYFILPQLEENPFCTSIIAPAADTAASQTRAASVVSASTSGVFPMVSATAAQDFAIFMRVVPKGINARGIFSSYLNATNYLSISSDAGGNMISRKLTAGVNDQIITPAVFSEDVVSQIIFVLTKSGISVKYKKNSGAWSSWSILDTETAKLPTVISGTYVIGGRQDIGQFTANYPRTAIIAMPPKATLAEYQTWIDEELTLRGLI